MTRAGPDWLADLQRRFGDALRAPLARDTGTLRATPEIYDPELVAGIRGDLAVYNRQYWFRLFDLFATTFPLIMRLCGAWSFNAVVARFVCAEPPRHWDLEQISDGFAAFFGAEAPPDEHDLWLDAVRLDAAWRTTSRAPLTPPWHPSAADAAHLLDARLELSPAAALLREGAPLSELRTELLRNPGEARVAMPARFPTTRHSLLVRSAEGTRLRRLETGEAELLQLLTTRSVRDALATLERSVPESERAALPARAQQWLARSVQLGVWSGFGEVSRRARS